jgi:3-deoxy-manno-octulosonate cytidylyltransferase (CMP-KDO synthetase)
LIRCCAIIPARYASSRFPGKPLAKIAGKPMIQHTYERVISQSCLDQVWIATDHEDIAQTARDFGADVLMTRPDCANGTERLVDALRQLPQVDSDAVVINVQGDEPLIDPAVIKAVAHALEAPDCVMSTASTPLHHEPDYMSRSVVKVVTDQQGKALYFSRAAIGSWSACLANPSVIRRHVGIYGYRRWFLEQYATLQPTPLQLAEDLEQLRVLEHGFPITVVPVHHYAQGVDLPEDVARVEMLLRLNQESALSI